MKEEELKRKHSIHKIVYRFEHNHEEQQTITREVDNGVHNLDYVSDLCLSG
jgi:hypothetical protein